MSDNQNHEEQPATPAELASTVAPPIGGAAAEEAVDNTQETSALQPEVDKPRKKARPSAARYWVLGCLGLVLILVVAGVTAAIGVRYWLGPDVLRDTLTVVFDRDVFPVKSAQLAPTLDPTDGKPEYKEMAKQLTGKWTGALPGGEKIVYEYKEDGQFSIQVQRPGDKNLPPTMFGGWTVKSVDGDTVGIHHQTFEPVKGDAFQIDATVTFAGADEMEHSLKRGTVKCRRETP